MSVVIAFEDAGPCRKQLTIEVPAPAVAAEVGRVVNDLRRNVKLPGFRQGKVPASLIERRFREDIEREVADRLIPRYWNQAKAEKSLQPLLPPNVEDVNLELGEGMTFVASVETRPTIQLRELDDLELPEESTEPNEQEIEEAILDLRRSRSTWVPVQRASAQGDLVVGHLRPLASSDDDEEADPGRQAQFEVGGEGLTEEISLALTNVSEGQSTEIELTPRDAEEGQPFRFDITAIKERELPELDDELAKEVGEFETVEALQEALVQQLGANKEQDLKRRRERKLMEELIDRHPLELPRGVVDRETESMLRETAENMVGQGVDLQQVELDWERLAEQIRPQAERRVHGRLLLDAVAEDRDIEVDEQRFERILSSLAAQQGVSTFALRQKLAEDGRLDELRQQVLREETIRHLLGEGDEDEAADTEGAADE